MKMKDLEKEAEINESEGQGDKKEEFKKKSANAGKELLNMLLYMAVVLVLTFLVVHYIGQRTQVSGHSMESTLSDRDNLIVDKITYRFADPKRFDIIVFPYQYKKNTYYIKRIIGLPGETVQVVDGAIYINGEVLSESYGREIIKNPGLAANVIQLGDDEYFVMGDNRNYSADSREPSVGNIKKKDIMGRAWIRIWPFDKFGILKHQ